MADNAPAPILASSGEMLRFSTDFVCTSEATRAGSWGLELASARAMAGSAFGFGQFFGQLPMSEVDRSRGGDGESDAQRTVQTVLHAALSGTESGTLHLTPEGDEDRGQWPAILGKGVGLLRVREYEWWCVRRLSWEQTGGVWRSSGWLWAPYDRRERLRLIRDGVLPISDDTLSGWIRSSGGQVIPGEIVRRIVDFFVRTPLHDLSAHLATDHAANMFQPVALKTDARRLKELSTVCRTWSELCAPLLYKRLSFNISNVHRLYELLRRPSTSPHLSGSQLRSSYVESVTITGPRAWAALPRLAVLVPHLKTMRLEAPSDEGNYHQTHPHIASISCRAFSRLTSLRMASLYFSSPSDLLRILASFPALESARVDQTQTSAKSRRSTNITVRTRSTRLRSLHCWLSIIPTEHFVVYWSWPHIADPKLGDFPGIPRSAIQVVTDLVHAYSQLTMPFMDSQSLSIERSEASETWILVYQSHSASFLELHVERTPATSPDGASTSFVQIRHAVLRVDPGPGKSRALDSQSRVIKPSWEGDEPDADRFRRDLRPLDECLSHLPHLRTVTIEAIDRLSHIPDAMPLVAEKLRLLSFEEAEHWTSAACGSVQADLEHDGPVSPFWSSSQYESQRRRLKEEVQRITKYATSHAVSSIVDQGIAKAGMACNGFSS